MPIATFRVYPDRSFTGKRGYYFTVNIFKTYKELRARIKENGSTWDTRRTLGCCQAWRKMGMNVDGSMSYKKEIGEIQLCTKCIGVGTVSHEALHAAMRWCDYKGIKVETCRPDDLPREKCEPEEERFAYALGDIVSQIYTELFNRKVIK